jgi:hypothetical protein
MMVFLTDNKRLLDRAEQEWVMTGAIIDVYHEGEPSFRACVCDTASNGGLWVINLKTGDRRLVCDGEFEPTAITNIFTMDI